LYLVIFWILLLGAVLPAAFYIWYLTWPVRTGRVTRVDEWVEPENNVTRAKKRRCVSFEYEWRGQTRTGTQQSLFLAHGFSPKKQAGQMIAVAVCPVAPRMACPWRPWLELCVVLAWSGFVLSAALIAFLQHLSGT
jgi:hypothetical protein